MNFFEMVGLIDRVCPDARWKVELKPKERADLQCALLELQGPVTWIPGTPGSVRATRPGDVVGQLCGIDIVARHSDAA